uniref:RxLR effector protein n=1 Tax=Phytophthora sojae TaxID=67593 RepID=G1FRT1_PHYSO|nr:Avh170 [Phytophthora sojae]AEK80819.1 Avh170 [Phytophthora sojae]
MRLQSIVLLVAATLLAAGLVVTDSRTVVTPSFRTSLRNDIPPTARFLRTGTTTDEDQDARTLNLIIARLESLTNRLKSASQLKVKELVNSGQNIDDAFLSLKLKDIKTDLFTNPDFKIWARFVKETDKQTATESMLATLQKNFGAKELTLMLQEAKDASKTAKKLQIVQFEDWASNSMWPEVAVAQVLQIDEKLILRSHRLSPARQIRAAYSA